MLRNPALAKFEREWGISFDGALDFIQPGWKSNFNLAMDAQPSLVTTAQSGIPSFLVTFLDPELLRILTAKNVAVDIFGEARKGSFEDVAVAFPVVEHTGEISAYGD